MAEPKPFLSPADTFAIVAVIGGSLATGLPVVAFTRAIILLFALGGALYLCFHLAWRRWKKWVAAALAVAAYISVVLLLFEREARETNTIAPTRIAGRWFLVHVASIPWAWMLVTAVLTVCVILLAQRRWRTKSKRSGSEVVINVTAPEVDLHVECKKKIARLLESESTHALIATAHENELKAFKGKYATPIQVANQHAAEIGRYVEVLRVCTHDVKLDDPMPTIKWSILLKNRSVYRIILDGNVGPLFFEGHKLAEHKELIENKIVGLLPDRDGSIVFEQRLSPSEVNLLKSLPNGKFEFDKVMLYVKGSHDEHVTSHRVVIFSRFRASLGQCSDERSQAVEELSAEMADLKARLNSAGVTFDIDTKKSQVGHVGVSKDSTKMQANVRLRCERISDSQQAVREFSAALFKITDGTDVVVLPKHHAVVVMQEPLMELIQTDNGWTIDERLTPFRRYQFFFDMRDDLIQVMLDNPRDYFFRVTMDAVGQDLQYQDFFVESWTNAVVSSSHIILRG